MVQVEIGLCPYCSLKVELINVRFTFFISSVLLFYKENLCIKIRCFEKKILAYLRLNCKELPK